MQRQSPVEPPVPQTAPAPMQNVVVPAEEMVLDDISNVPELERELDRELDPFLFDFNQTNTTTNNPKQQVQTFNNCTVNINYN